MAAKNGRIASAQQAAKAGLQDTEDERMRRAEAGQAREAGAAGETPHGSGTGPPINPTPGRSQASPRASGR